MPKRSSVSQLPEAVKAELDRQLVDRNFADYQQLAEWLSAQGYGISRSAIHRYGQEFENQLAAIKLVTEQAKVITESVGDDANALADALTRLAQQKAFQALLALDLESAEDLSLTKLGQMVAALNRSSISLKKYQIEIKEQLDLKLKKLDAEGSAGKLDADTLRRVREEVYGIFT